MNLKHILIGLTLLAQNSLHAAIANHSANPSRPIDTLTALGLPLENRIETLRLQGPSGYKNLIHLMNDESANMETRWRAVTAMGQIGGKLSLPELKTALHSKSWYLRNAALISSQQVDRGQALAWAKELLSDKALVVRSAAVDVLADIGDRHSTDVLWKKLDSRENFRGKQSLWIRRKIVESLAKIEGQGSEKKFVALLSDRDETLYRPAIEALERLTNKKFGKLEESPNLKRHHWQAWAKSSQI
jgi:HEAT repeat protein